MSNVWAIAIGINQYQHFQPLLYAQHDAQSLHQFWVTEAGLPIEQTILMIDVSQAVNPYAVSPTRHTLQTILPQICQQKLKAGDLLWFFFCGYGVRFQGKDFLMPSDGDPEIAAATGISLEWLFDQLAQAPTDQIVVMLDMNHSQSALANEQLGAETLELAQRHNITTFLSCAPDQFSYETLNLRQGLFTAALLQGLRYGGCFTPEQLLQHLSHQLPQLSEHYWRPRQDPRAYIPAAQRYQLLVPEKAIALFGQRSTHPSTHATISTVLLDQHHPLLESGNGLPTVAQSLVNPSDHGTASNTASNHSDHQVAHNGAALTPPAASTLNGASSVAPDPTSDPVETSEPFWRSFLVWMVPLVAALLVGVMVSHRKALMQNSSPLPAAPTSNQGATSPADPANLENSAAIAQAPINPTSLTVAPTPLVSTDNSISSNNLASPSAATPSTNVAMPISPSSEANPLRLSSNGSTSMLDGAKIALQNRNFSESLRLLSQVPTNRRGDDYAKVLAAASEGVLNQARAEVSLPRATSEVNQASDFSRAIQLARFIRPEYPNYAAAQHDIHNWSQAILDLATGRAHQLNQGTIATAATNYHFAIQAAKLVPPDQSEVYVNAERAIAEWGQAILDLSTVQATEGDLPLAILTAEKVPPNTPIYDAARRAMKEWQSQLEN